MKSRGMSGKWNAMAFVSVPEVGDGVLRPLVGLREQHAVLEAPVDVLPHLAQKGVRLGKVLAVRSLALEEVRDGVEPQPVDAHPEPEVECLEDGSPDCGIREVEIGLMGVEAMPVVRLGDRIPGPVRGLEVLEDHAGVAVALGRVAPDVEVAGAAARGRSPRALEPGVLIGRVVDDQLGDHAQPAAMRFAQERAEVLERAEVPMHAVVVGDVVAVVAQRRGVERQQPESGDPDLVQVVESLREAVEVADAVAVAVVEGADA
jgi:hypothetical protein